LLRSRKNSAAGQIPLRLVYLAFGVASFMLLYSAGAYVDMTRVQAQDYANQFIESTRDIDQNGIFLNNVKIAFGMFVPAFGAGLGGYSAFATGLTFKALAIVNPALGNMSPLIILATPFGILEVFAYGLAMSRSAMLTLQLIKRKGKIWLWEKQFLSFTLVEIALVIIALLIGAAVEAQAITSTGT
jgi:hypothetical protein